MEADRRGTTTSLGFLAVVVSVVGGGGIIDGIPAGRALDAQMSWRGLVVAPEQGCWPYDADEYRHRQSVEDRIVAELGGFYGRYAGRWFASKTDTDIEHMVVRSEAHDSGLCAANLATWRRFATDRLNLTLAGPRVNRYEKVESNAAEWLPTRNRCWFAAGVSAVRQRYGLTIDRREADALDRVLAGCAWKELITLARSEVPATVPPAVRVPEAIAAWGDNRTGRASRAEAQERGIAPVTRGHPAYPFMRDGDAAGVVCESGSRRAFPTSPPASHPCVPSRMLAVPQLHGAAARSSQRRSSWSLYPSAPHGPRQRWPGFDR